ncbi:MAG: hypothetical protein LBD58_07845, partial [Treponema sp.]|nr:hypothetical protein [Treponema sp.]
MYTDGGGSPLVPHVGVSGAGERAAHAAFRRAEAGRQGAEWLSREDAQGEAAEAVFVPAAKIESAAGRRAFARKRAVEAGGGKLDERSRGAYGRRKTFGKTMAGNAEKRAWKSLAGRAASRAAAQK